MIITRLNVNPLLYFGLYYQFARAIFLMLNRFRDHGVRCDFWVGSASGARHYLEIDDHSASFISIANGNSIVERHEEGVGIPAKGGM